MDEKIKKQMGLFWSLGVVFVFIGLVINFFFPLLFKDFPLIPLLLLGVINFLFIGLIIQRIKYGEIDRGYFKEPIIKSQNPGKFWQHMILVIAAEVLWAIFFAIFLITYIVSIID